MGNTPQSLCQCTPCTAARVPKEIALPRLPVCAGDNLKLTIWFIAERERKRIQEENSSRPQDRPDSYPDLLNYELRPSIIEVRCI
jgi:hypothetical protein